MAIVQVYPVTPSGDWYEGLAADGRPDGTLAGSVFTETDTGQRWIFDGVSWSRISSNEMQLRLLWALAQNTEPLAAAQDSEHPPGDS